ncbi:MAG: UMP kinase [Planctomycetota bacterium]
MKDTVAYRRILLKLSGEALAREGQSGVDPKALADIAGEIRRMTHLGVETAVVVGGGNFFRGAGPGGHGLVRATADHMGMLATVMNALALADACEAVGAVTDVYSSFRVDGMAPRFDRKAAIKSLVARRVVLLAGGTGSPFFTTDTAAALRAAELEAEVIFKATKVDGVYAADPFKDRRARRFDRISFRRAIEMRLKVMDLTALSFCYEHRIPIRVFNMRRKGNLEKLARGEAVGTLVS